MYFYFFKKESTISCLKKEAKLPNISYFNQNFMKNLKKKRRVGLLPTLTVPFPVFYCKPGDIS